MSTLNIYNLFVGYLYWYKQQVKIIMLTVKKLSFNRFKSKECYEIRIS